MRERESLERLNPGCKVLEVRDKWMVILEIGPNGCNGILSDG